MTLRDSRGRFTRACIFCGDPIERERDGDTDTCDGCWFGMRMAPEEWKADLAAKGRTVEKGPGCVPFGSGEHGGFICFDPYVPGGVT